MTLELTHGPVALEAFILEKGALPRVFDTDEFEKLALGELQEGFRREGRR